MKRKIILGVSAGLIGPLAVAGAAFAQEGPDCRNPADSIKDRVAEILGVNREDLDTDISKARGESRDTNQDEKFLSLVQDGLITKTQADKIKRWSRSRPSVMDEVNRFRCGRGDNSGIEARLSALVAQKVISRSEADEVIAWIDEKSEFLDELPEVIRSDRGGIRGRRDRYRQWRSEQRPKYFNKHAPDSEAGMTSTLRNDGGIKL